MNVLIAEDHNLTAKLLERMLSQNEDINVVGVVSNGLGVLKAASEQVVDVVLMDIAMPYLDGMETMERLFQGNSAIKVLILSAHTEGWIIEKSIGMGASGYLTKKVDTKQVIDAIMAVYNGGNYLDDISLQSIVSYTSGRSQPFQYSYGKA